MDHDRHLRHAARLAIRGHGGASPNPLVGCVIVSPQDQVVGWGYHRQCGGPHAEIHALRRAGEHARGATAYITLEPCNHTGRTGPCAEALIKAGVKRVVVARLDPHHDASGGLDRLRDAGVEVECLEETRPASSCMTHPASLIADPFVHRVQTGLPWVTVKWAQTLDGRIATRTGESQWISTQRSRRMVHRERGRIDAILTGIGTALSDDPKLTARDVRVRRVARRVVIDENLDIALDRHLITHAHNVPTTLVCSEPALLQQPDKASAIDAAGVELIGMPLIDGSLCLRDMLCALSTRHDIANVLVEAGPGLVSRLFRDKLVNEAWVFIAPMLLGDDDAPAAVRDMDIQHLTDGTRLKLIDQRYRDGDVVLRYRTMGSGR